MKFYCAECFEEIGNCQPWCSESAREREQRHCRCVAQKPDDRRLGPAHEPNCPLYAVRFVVQSLD